MDHGPLVKEAIDDGAELVRLLDKHELVKAAFWLKASESPYRDFYIAAEGVDERGLRAAYGEVLPLVHQIRSPYLDAFRVNLIDADSPLARAVIAINERFPGRDVKRFPHGFFGGIDVEDLYIYPRPMPVATG